MKLLVVRNKIIPFKGFKAITVLKWLFVRMKTVLTDTLLRHESIHMKQQIELTIVGALLALVLFVLGCGWWSLLALPLFFWWYGLEYVIRIPLCDWNTDKAYKSIVFEQEAYGHQDDVGYLEQRKWFAWIKYYFKK